jgi:hypothetical protein
MLNVYYFFSIAQPTYLPTEIEIGGTLKHYMRSIYLGRIASGQKRINNIVMVP